MIKRLSFLVLIFSCLSACKVQFVSDPDARLADQVEEAAQSVDYFYLNLQDNSTSEFQGRAFQNFSDDYLKIEVKLNSIVRRNRLSPLNNTSYEISQIALTQWQSNKAKHKAKDQLSDEEITSCRQAMNELFYAILSENEGEKYLSQKKP